MCKRVEKEEKDEGSKYERGMKGSGEDKKVRGSIRGEEKDRSKIVKMK